MTVISDNEILVNLEHFNDKDDGIKRDAIESLNGVKDARILFPLIKALQEEDQGVQQAAVDALISFDDEAAVYNVIPLLFDNRVNVRNMAQEILEHIGGSGVKLMGLHIKDKDENVRKMIADILGKIKGEESTSLLLEMVADSNNNVRSSAAEGLGRVGDSSAVEHLIKLLNDDEWVAFFAAVALGKIGDIRAIRPLLQFIKSSSDYLQITGIEALGQVCSDKYVDDFICCLEYVSPSAKITVVENLIKITHGNLEKVPDNFVNDKLFNYIAEIINKNEVNDFDSKKDFIQALLKLNSKDSSEYILKLLTGVESDNQDIIINAIEALKLLGDEDTLIN